MHLVCIQWEEIGPDDSRFQLKSHVPTNIKLHIAWKIIHKIRTSNYSRQAGHAQVPFDPSKELVRSESAERKNGERGNPNCCLLGFCLPLSSLVIDVFGLDTIYTNSSYSTTLFPHPSAVCILPSTPASVPQISL